MTASEHESRQGLLPGKKLSRLWLAISGHGHGHLVQVVPLVRALRERYPALVLAIQSSLPESLLRQSFGDDVEIHREAVDFGMVMSGPMKVLPEESLAAYRQFHDTWPEQLALQIARFRQFQPDLLIADIPYLPLAAARACAVPSVAVCSLNWADILEHYCAGFEAAEDLVAAIRGHYAAADLFLRPQPSMPMATLGNTVSIGPLVSVGKPRRRDLHETLQVPQSRRLVLLTLGGISGQMDLGRWPWFDNTLFLVPATWLEYASEPLDAERFCSIESTGMSFPDLFASCDALITKPGYGAFAGAGCCGLPVLYTERGDWPEEGCLSGWLKSVGRARSISRTELIDGNFKQALDELLAQASKPAATASGAVQALESIESLF